MIRDEEPISFTKNQLLHKPSIPPLANQTYIYIYMDIFIALVIASKHPTNSWTRKLDSDSLQPQRVGRSRTSTNCTDVSAALVLLQSHIVNPRPLLSSLDTNRPHIQRLLSPLRRLIQIVGCAEIILLSTRRKVCIPNDYAPSLSNRFYQPKALHPPPSPSLNSL